MNDFLEVLLSDPGPQCLMWLPLIHRMASVENGNVLWLLFLHFHKSLSFERKKMYKFDMKFIILVMLHFTFLYTAHKQ